MTPYPLDKFDLKILSYLQSNGRCSNVELADVVGLSQSPCLLRTKRLESAGYIVGYGAEIALEQLGEHIIVITEVTLQQRRPSDFKRFEERIIQYKEITECLNVSGGYDYLLRILASSLSNYQMFTEQLLEEDIGITKLSHRVVLKQPIKKREYPLEVILPDL
ncbi:MAG: Lrp/AsnC family transcriptional regulator [Gammaproteobacteria bacterium]|nr:Lrp/AsnC family transcriptional regulator [Gammaproteobacteria bacterium]